MLMAVEKTHSYYCNTDQDNRKTINTSDLERNAKSSDAIQGLLKAGSIVKIEYMILNPKNIKVSQKDNVAQSTGNTPMQIKQFAGLFSEFQFDPYVDLLPIVIQLPDGTFVTCGGYKRIIGAKNAAENYDEITVPCIVVTPSDDCDKEQLQTKLNIIENQRPNKENLSKTHNTIESYVNAVQMDIERAGHTVDEMKRLSTEEFKSFIAPHSPSKDKLKYEDIINRILESNGVEVPVYTTTAASKKLVINDLLEKRDLEMRPHVISYDVKNNVKANQDRLWHYINGMKTVLDNKRYDHLVIVVQHTGVSSEQAKKFNEEYLKFESNNGTVNQVYVGKEDKSTPVPVIFGIINNRKITYVDGSLDNIPKRSTVC
jgi:hypothetical protein